MAVDFANLEAYIAPVLGVLAVVSKESSEGLPIDDVGGGGNAAMVIVGWKEDVSTVGKLTST